MHGSPRLNLYGRQLLVDRVGAGWSVAAAAEAAGVSRATGHKWIRRYREEGAALGMFWYMQGLLTEGRQQLRASLDAAPTDSPHRATGLYPLGLLEHRHADYEDAGARFDAAGALFNARGDVASVGRPLPPRRLAQAPGSR